LEGKARDEAARQLGWSLGTLKRRLSQGRMILRDRLTRRGLTLSGVLAAVGLSQETVPAAIVISTARAAACFAAGSTAGVSAKLAEAVLKGILLVKLKIAVTLALAVGFVGVGMGLIAYQVSTEEQPEKSQSASEGTRPEKPVAKGKALMDRYGDPLPSNALLRLGTVRFRHEGEAGSLSFSPDGKILASTSRDSMITLWDVRTGKAIRRLIASDSESKFYSHIFAIDFSPDGSLLASRGTDHAIRFWDVTTGEQLRKTVLSDLHEENGVICFSPDGKSLAVPQMDRDPAARRILPKVTLLDVATGKERLHLEFKGGVATLAFSPDGTILAVRAAGSGTELWDLAMGKLLRTLKEQATSLAFSRNGKVLAIGGKDQIVLWNVETGAELGKLETKMDFVMSLAFTPDGQTLFSGSQHGKVRIWDLPSKQERRQLDSHTSLVRGMALSKDGKLVAAGTTDSTLRLWEVATGRELFTDFDGHDAQVNSVAFSPDGKWLASGGDNHQILLWRAATGKLARKLQSPNSARVVAFSPDGKRLATVWPNSALIRVWDVAIGERRLELRKEGLGAKCVAFFSDGEFLITAHSRGWHSRVGETTLNLWDASTGKHLREFSLHSASLESLAVAPDNHTIALGTADGTLRLWDIQARKEILVLTGHNHSVDAVAFSPSGRTLASGSMDQTCRLWEVATGKTIYVFQGHQRSVSSVAFSADGQMVASGSGATGYPLKGTTPHKIRFWDVATGKESFQLQGHDSNVNSVAFSPDGSRLASGLRNSTVLLWDLTAVRPPRPEAKPLDSGDLERLWSELADGDAGTAYRTIGLLVRQPAQAVPFLKGQLQPAVPVDQEQVQKRIADLDNDRFTIREAALRELESIGGSARPLLRQALQGQLSQEARRRIEQLLEKLQRSIPSAQVRELRAIEVLEATETTDTRQILQKLAQGAPEARLTQEAKAALERLAKRR
jgi:WD40 repeat protein